MDFQSYLTTSAEEIDRELKRFFKIWRKEAKKVNNALLPLTDAAIKACEGGKRLRGTLVKLGFELSGAQYTDEILKPAAAYEIVQTALLIHDDIFDKSPLRRGHPTVYQALGGDHYGKSQAVCLGDTGFFQAFQLITRSNFSLKRKLLAVDSFSNTLTETALGEMLDIEIPHLNSEKLEKDVMTILNLKTARYTAIGPLHLGAILGGAGQKLLNELELFGENLGIAFQIHDDILGVFGREEKLGKSTYSDIIEGKNTLLITYAWEHADIQQKKVLKRYYGRGKIGQKEFEQIKKVFVGSGALDYSRKKELEYVSIAKKRIPKITGNRQKQQLLYDLADFLVERDR